MVKKMLEVVVKYLYPAFTKVKILAFTVYSSLSRICRARVPVWRICALLARYLKRSSGSALKYWF